MNVGFRPRLKARPSLYDLITNRNIDFDCLSASSPTKLIDLGELPALPDSRPSTLILEEHLESVHTQATMPPKKDTKNADTDGEEQYGTDLQLMQRLSS
jgi:V-type H+-transporting ATPase subunit A